VASGRLRRSVPTTVTGDPVRSTILAVRARRAEIAAEARETFGFAETRTTVVVFGGSQGALHLDEAVAGALSILADRDDLQLLVITGPEHTAVVERAVAAGVPLRVCVLPFLERMELAYALADLTVTRAGATSIAEMTVCGLPMVLVPYPHATENHQQANAVEMVRAGAALMELDAELTSERLAARILELVDDDARRRLMAQASAAWGRPDADRRLASLVLEHAR